MQHLEWITCHTELSFIAVSLSLFYLSREITAWEIDQYVVFRVCM